MNAIVNPRNEIAKELVLKIFCKLYGTKDPIFYAMTWPKLGG